MKLLFLLIPLMGFSMEYEKFNRVYDGDTIYVDLKCSEELVCKNMGIRLKRVNCAEIRNTDLYLKQQAITAKLFTTDFIKDGFRISECKRDAYFRLDCEVYNSKNENLSDALLKKGICPKSNFK